MKNNFLLNKRNSALFLISFFLFIKCAKDAFNINIPEEIKIDINLDDKDDFKIIYTKTNIDELPRNIDPDTLTYDKSILCSIHRLNDNELLLEEFDLIKWKLPKLQFGDTINRETSNNLFWSKSQAGNLATIRRYKKSGEWESEWKSLVSQPTYLGTILRLENEEELCWIKLNINNIIGEIELLNQKCTKSNLIVINE